MENENVVSASATADGSAEHDIEMTDSNQTHASNVEARDGIDPALTSAPSATIPQTTTSPFQATPTQGPIDQQTQQQYQQPSSFPPFPPQQIQPQQPNGIHTAAQAQRPQQQHAQTLADAAASAYAPTLAPAPSSGSPTTQGPSAFAAPAPQQQQPMYPAPSASVATNATPPQRGLTPQHAVPTQQQQPMSQTIPMPAANEAGSSTRVYLNQKVTPALLEGMKWIAANEPEKPLMWLGEFLIKKSEEVERKKESGENGPDEGGG